MNTPRDDGLASSVRWRRAIESGQVALLYEQFPSAALATVILGLLLAVGLRERVSPAFLGIWLVIVIGWTVWRYGLLLRYRRSASVADSSSVWQRPFLAGVAVNGILWGVAGVGFFSPQSVPHQMLLAFVLAGMGAGAVTTLSPLKIASPLFLIPALVPFTIRMFLQEEQPHALMGTMLALFVVSLWVISRRLHATVERSLRLRFENLDLIDDLRRARERQDEVHAALAAQVEQKRQVQRALEESHGVLEERVAQRTVELEQIGDRLEMEKELFRITLASIGDGVITTDRQGHITFLNPIAEQVTGWHSHEVSGRPLAEAFQVAHEAADPNERERAVTALPPVVESRSTGQLLLTDRSGFRRHVHYTAAPILDRQAAKVGTVLTFRDISEERRIAQQLTHQATHDALTGLVNRREFERRLERVLQHAAPHDPHALLFMDLDRFKVVNDTCGHVAGDELLRQIAALMRNRIRARDTFGRLGGDEFGVLLEHCRVDEATRIANTLRELAQDFRFGWQDKSFGVGVSIGLVKIAGGWENAASVLRAADNACYLAKDRGRNRVHVYEPDDRLEAQRQGDMQWLPRLQQALAEGRLRLYRQPIVPVRAADQGLELGEVLVRLVDEQGDIVLPGAFLAAAERYGQIGAIDRWVVGETITALKGGGAVQGAGTRLSVNLSGQSLGDPDALDFISERIKDSGIAASSLCFEITETAAISNLTNALPFMTQLRELGCRFSLDDFGNGLSSFGYLKTLPVDYLKIDGRFVKEIANDRVDETMVEAIHRLGKVMGLKTVAEWVENAETLQKVSAMNIDYAQGFHLGSPRPM
ncbi:EAL domain-containing protein [Methylolobus aquaticus]